MPQDKDPKPKQFEWKGGERTPEETEALNRKVLRERGLAYPGKQEQKADNLLEGVDPDILKLARLKAEQILARSSYHERMSALAHVDAIIRDKTPKQMIEALDHVVLARHGISQLASEIELALAFLMLTEDDSTETK